jgi:hypothetical protein
MSKPKPAAGPPSAPAAPQQLPRDRIVFGGLLLWTFLSLCFPMMDTDFWWHLRTGELILEQRAVPQVDLYTYTDYDKPWIDLHWGFQLLITGLYRLGGVELVTLAKAAIITGAVAIAWFAGGRNLPTWLKAMLWIPAVISISGRGYERPEMLTQLFLAAWLWIAVRVAERPRLIWLLPIVQVVWVNCHALFVLGLVVGAAYAADCLAREFAGGRWGLAPPARQPSGQVIVRAGALVAVACLANPYFEEGAKFPLTLYRKFSVDYDFYSVNIGEFRPPIAFLKESFRRQKYWEGATNVYLLSEATVWCVTAASFACLAWRRRRWSVMRVLLFAGFSHLAWKATRNTNIFAIVSVVIACENLAEALSLSAADLRKSPPIRRYGFSPAWVVGTVLCGLILAVVTGAWANIAEKDKVFALGERPHWFIHDAAKFAGQPGFPKLAFVANNGQAAVYTYHNSPERRVFMDARLEVCTKETFEIYNKILDAMAAGNLVWQQELFRRSGGELPVIILDSRGSRFQINALVQTPGWRLVFADRAGAVFLTTEQADKLELPAVSPESLMYPDGRSATR